MLLLLRENVTRQEGREAKLDEHRVGYLKEVGHDLQGRRIALEDASRPEITESLPRGAAAGRTGP